MCWYVCSGIKNNNSNNIFGRRLTGVSEGDPRETMHPFRQVSLAVQHYNSVAFKETFLVPTKLDYCHSS